MKNKNNVKSLDNFKKSEVKNGALIFGGDEGTIGRKPKGMGQEDKPNNP